MDVAQARASRVFSAILGLVASSYAAPHRYITVPSAISHRYITGFVLLSFDSGVIQSVKSSVSSLSVWPVSHLCVHI